MTNKDDLPDIQNTQSNHNVYLERVGIEDLELPIMVMQKDGKFQQTVAKINCYVDLADNIKGISMSRLLEVLHNYTYKQLNANIVKEINDELIEKSESKLSEVIIEFPYFVEKTAPSSNKKGYINHKIKFKSLKINDFYYFDFGVSVVVTSLCPCSKEISNCGAHNQKCYIDVEYSTTEWIWIEDIINELEKCGSSQIYSILKRPDEKIVTETAYNNPLFVEDIARNVITTLENIKGIKDFKVSVRSDESIHLHKAVALTIKKR